MAINSTTVIIIAFSVGVVFVIVFTLVVAYLIRRRNKQHSEYVRLAIEESLARKVQEPPQIIKPSDDKNDSLMNARYFLRNDDRFEFKETLWHMGIRDKKTHFIVKRKDNGEKLLMTIQSKGKDLRLPLHNNTTRNQIKNLLTCLSHPYILPTIEATFLPGKEGILITFKPFSFSKGSLKDQIYKTKPEKPFDEKYSANGKPLALKQIKQYGRQILEILQFFQVIHFPYNQLHSGNVIIFNGICKITDYENILMGHKSRYHDFTRDQTPLKDFGCLLFEMACGYEPTRKDIKTPPAQCPQQVIEILHSIFLSNPSPVVLDDIILHPFFDVVPEGLKEDSGVNTDLTPESLKLLEIATTKRSKSQPQNALPNTNSNSEIVISPQSFSNSYSSSSLSDQINRPRDSNPSIKVDVKPSTPIPAPIPPPMRSSVVQSSSLSSSPWTPPSGTPDRGSLLSSIRQGKKLKKAKTNDRSAPLI